MSIVVKINRDTILNRATVDRIIFLLRRSSESDDSTPSGLN